MKTVLGLTPGVDYFTLLEIIRMAAVHKGLELDESCGFRGYSKPIKEYIINDEILAVLEKGNIKRQDRSDCEGKLFTLVDENPQEGGPRYSPGNYWNFQLLESDKSKFDLRVKLHIYLYIDVKKRGVVLIPKGFGPYVSPFDSLSHFRMFAKLADSDDKAPAVAKELAASDGSIVISWTELGLGGIRSLSQLFSEFAGDNERIARLGELGEVFDPIPNPRYEQPKDKLFITEPAQPKLFQVWRAQLNEYRFHFVA